ncbi:MAG: protein-export chaperone SecB [Peptococcia bacterium]
MNEEIKEKNSVDEYREFIKGTKIKNITLKKLETIKISAPEDGIWEYEMKTDFHLDRYEGNTLYILAKFNVIARNKKNKEKNDDNESRLFEIEILFNIEYHNPSGTELSEKDRDRFLHTNVPLNVWPYARELISSLTTRMGYPPLLILPFKVY